jgi:hypothetical protein
MAYEPQVVYVRELLLSPNKQTTFGTAVPNANLSYRARFDGGVYATIGKEYFSDLERAGKGHPWPTVRTEVMREITLRGQVDIDDFLAGWLPAFLMMKDAVSGVGPFTHALTFEQTTRIAPVTTVYFRDTAAILWKVTDLVMTSLQISGSERGPLQASFEMMGSGKHVDGSVTAPALPTPVYLMGQDSDILIGAPAAAASIKERVRSWSVSLVSGGVQHRAPGGGLFSSFAKIGLQRATVQLAVAAKDTDDLRTLFINDTLQELQINTNSGAAAQLNLKLPNLKFKVQPSSDGLEVIQNLSADERDVLKGAALEIFQATAINSQATFLVGA